MYWMLLCHFFTSSEFHLDLVYVFAEALKRSASSLFPFQAAVGRITLAPFCPDTCLGLVFHCSAKHLLTILPGKRSKALSQKFYPSAPWQLSLQYLNIIRRMKAYAYVSLWSRKLFLPILKWFLKVCRPTLVVLPRENLLNCHCVLLYWFTTKPNNHLMVFWWKADDCQSCSAWRSSELWSLLHICPSSFHSSFPSSCLHCLWPEKAVISAFLLSTGLLSSLLSLSPAFSAQQECGALRQPVLFHG